MLRDMEIATDILGNQMPGVFEYKYNEKEKFKNRKRVNTKYNEPYNNMLLEIPYHIGNTNEIEYVDGILKGDILSELLIIPYDSDGNEIESTIKHKFYADSNITLNDVYKRNISSSVIKMLFNIPETITVKLKVKYQIGAELAYKDIYDDNGRFWVKLYYPKKTGGGISAGVVYEEEFTLVEKSCKYYTSDSKNNILKYYSLESDTRREYSNNDFENVNENEQQAKFSLAVNGFSVMGYGNLWPNALEGKNQYGDYKYDRFNGEMLSPTVREEYMFGVSDIQNVDKNIYIDRGINSLFEKQMKLNEVKTLDALMLYGNSWFKIDS
jgi:hypothetical protein